METKKRIEAKQQIIERAKKNGTFERINSLLSACHLIRTAMLNIQGEAEDLLEENYMMMGKLKKAYDKYDKAQEQYFKAFGQMMLTPETRMQYLKDADALEKGLRQALGLEMGWKPKEVK